MKKRMQFHYFNIKMGEKMGLLSRKSSLLRTTLITLLGVGLAFAGENQFTIGKNRLTVDPDLAAMRTREAVPAERKVRLAAVVDESFNEQFALSLGWKLENRRGKFVTLSGDKETIHYLNAAPGVVQFNRPSKGELHMDIAREKGKVEPLHNSALSSLDRTFTGKGVIVGIIDSEFDHQHPAFLDANGKSRFIAIWDQAAVRDAPAISQGRAPFGGVLYGDELAEYPFFAGDKPLYHGTHVLSTAAGSDVGNSYTGVAPEAHLIACRYTGDNHDFENNVMEGINWIFHLADSLEMPCVINISLGNQMGPHDGTSIFDQWAEEVTGKGRIIVNSASNNGGRMDHVKFDLTKNPAVQTQVWCVGPAISTFWGEKDTPFSMKLYVRNTYTGELFEGNRITTNESFDSFDTIAIPGSSEFNLPAGEITVSMGVKASDPANGRSNIHLELNGGNIWYRVIIEISGEGVVHAWNQYQSEFSPVSPAIEGIPSAGGDDEYLINGMGGNSPHVITVGAYVTRNEVYDYQGVHYDLDVHFLPEEEKEYADHYRTTPGDIAFYSSKGPTADERIKPDITAPGHFIVAAASEHLDGSDVEMYPMVVWDNPDSPKGRYTTMSGTSMATPFTTGVVALMLQASDTLSPATVRSCLQASAIQDSHTGDIKPCPVWGAGKINALGAVEAVLAGSGATSIGAEKGVKMMIPTFTLINRNVLISGIRAGSSATLSIVNLQGRVLYSKEIRKDGALELPKSLSKAVYIMTLRDKQSLLTPAKKIVLQ